MPDLRISLVSSFSGNEYDDKFKSVFNNLVSYVKNENPEFNFNGIELLKLSYESEPFILSRNCIASLTPAKFLACKESLNDKIIPILTVKKFTRNYHIFQLSSSRTRIRKLLQLIRIK